MPSGDTVYRIVNINKMIIIGEGIISILKIKSKDFNRLSANVLRLIYRPRISPGINLGCVWTDFVKKFLVDDINNGTAV